MKKLTQRENLLKLYCGELPDWVPIQEHACQVFFGPGFITDWMKKPGLKKGDRVYDLFGVEYEVTAPGICPMPATDTVKITDIRKWREQFPVQCFPDLKEVNWEACARNDTADWNRKEYYTKVLIGGAGTGTTFEWITALMGNENAIIAMMTEPDDWQDIMEVMTAWQEVLISKVAYYYRPDSIIISDDVAYSKSLFMSPETYRECIKPYHRRLLKAIAENGCVPEIHCCGKAELIVGDFVEMGVRCWNPAQVYNDLEGIKACYGNRLILEGAWDSLGPAGVKGATEEMVRGAVRTAMDRYAPNGGYVFSISGMTMESDVGKEHLDWIYDEAIRYGAVFYQ